MFENVMQSRMFENRKELNFLRIGRSVERLNLTQRK